MLSPYHPLQLVLGLSVWIVWFSAMYAGLSLACVAAAPSSASLMNLEALSPINIALLIATFATSALLAWWARRCWRARKSNEVSEVQRIVAAVGAGIHTVGAIATIAVGIPVLVLPPCI